MDCLLAQPPIPEVFPVIGIFVVLLAVMVVVPMKLLIFCMLFHKAGYSWAFGLLMLVPLVNIIMIFILAFGDWPVRRELRQLKQMR